MFDPNWQRNVFNTAKKHLTTAYICAFILANHIPTHLNTLTNDERLISLCLYHVIFMQFGFWALKMNTVKPVPDKSIKQNAYLGTLQDDTFAVLKNPVGKSEVLLNFMMWIPVFFIALVWVSASNRIAAYELTQFIQNWN